MNTKSVTTKCLIKGSVSHVVKTTTTFSHSTVVVLRQKCPSQTQTLKVSRFGREGSGLEFYKQEFDRNESRWVWVSKCQTFLRCIFFSFWNWIQDFLKKKTKDYRSAKPFLVQVKLLKRGDDSKLRTDRILLAAVWKMKIIPTNFWPLVCLCL